MLLSLLSCVSITLALRVMRKRLYETRQQLVGQHSGLLLIFWVVGSMAGVRGSPEIIGLGERYNVRLAFAAMILNDLVEDESRSSHRMLLAYASKAADGNYAPFDVKRLLFLGCVLSPMIAAVETYTPRAGSWRS